MTHADRVKEAERAVVNLCVEMFNSAVGYGRVLDATAELLALRAATCPRCDGRGMVPIMERCANCDMEPCHANCDNGRRREG